MDVKSAEKSFQNVTYGDRSFDDLVEHVSSPQTAKPYHLSLFIGKDEDKKQDALKEIADATNRQIKEVNANDIISRAESETSSDLDMLFNKYDANDTILHLKNGSRLCGVYTGYTHSKVKYATPQERYFLKKVQQAGGFFIIDINDSDDADTTLRRAAQSIVEFPEPQSMFKNLMRKLKGVTMHGYQIKTERPEHYGETSGNF